MAAPGFGISSLDNEISLFKLVMKGDWDTIICNQYKRDSNTHLQKVTWLGDTALHVAVAGGLKDTVKSLLQAISDSTAPPKEEKHDQVPSITEKMETAPKEKDHDQKRRTKSMSWFQQVLRAKNKDGNTPLHIAASIGNAAMCWEIAHHDTSLVSERNNAGETPLFLAAHHGHTDAFLCFVHICGHDANYTCCSRNDGQTVLHSAIFGQYFNLAFQIIRRFPRLVERFNEEGDTPLETLARKPSAFKSGSNIGGWDWETLIYNCIFVDPLKEATSFSIEDETSPNDNHETESFGSLRNIVGQACGHSKTDLEAPKEHDTDSNKGETRKGTNKKIPSNYDSCVLFFKSIMTVLLIIFGVGNLSASGSRLVKQLHMLMVLVLGMGYTRVNRLKQLKEKHTWSVQIMNKLIENNPNMYAFDKGGELGISTIAEDEIPTSVPNPQSQQIPNMSDESEESNMGKKETATVIDEARSIVEIYRNFLETVKSSESKESTRKDKRTSKKARKLETAMLIAARNGITEMAEAILKEFPVAVNDVDAEEKNIVLLAVQTRQLKLYKMLLKYYSPYNQSSSHGSGSPLVLNDRAFRMVDRKGNSALHLAAKRKTNHQSWPIPGAALQMKWDIEWHKFIEKSMPPNFFIRHNAKGKNPEEIFTESHEELVKEGGEWLRKTSESCSVVAALIATVAFATSTSIPGGTNDINGRPKLENQFAFKMFGITSLVSLTFSVTSLSMFLSILTSRYQKKDFERSLPWKLLLGLTSLFVSIASVLVSFCSGHFFVLGDTLKYAAFPVYAFTCLPISFFAAAQFPLYFDLIRATFGGPFGGSSSRVEKSKKLIQVTKVPVQIVPLTS